MQTKSNYSPVMIDSLVQVVNKILDIHDPTATGHQSEVALFARAIAQEMKHDKDVVDCVSLAGQIHDIGKISIPPAILTFPGKLTRTQRLLVMSHPQVSYEILTPIDFPWPVADTVRQHHERLDGSGYPNGLTGDSIRVEAKILAVADVVQAMLTERPYHPPFTIADVLGELDAHKGILYDAAVVDTYRKLIIKNGNAVLKQQKRRPNN